MTMRRVLLALQFVLIVAGLAALGYCLLSWISAQRFQGRETQRFTAALERNIGRLAPGAIHSTRPNPSGGALFGKIQIPRLKFSAIVVEGVEERDLSRAVGHIPGTAFPWQPGNVAIAGHRDTFFRCLRSIRHNDTITLTTMRGTYRYRVLFTTVVSPSDVSVLRTAKADELTLVTCFPFYYVGAAPERFIVRAVRG